MKLSTIGFATLLGLALAAQSSPVDAKAPMQKTQAPGYQRIMVGDFEVTALSDGYVPLDLDKLLHQPPAKTDAALAKLFLKSPLDTSVTAYLVNTGDKLVLIDTGAGALFGPTGGKLFASLKAAGYTPEQVDEILITHVHPDHVGGLAANGKVLFPNATVHAGKGDVDFFLAADVLTKVPAEMKDAVAASAAALKLYQTAGKLKTIDGNGAIVPGISSVSSFGHTPGHTSFVVESKGTKLVVLGDLIHAGPLQFEDPTITIGFDADQKAAAASRKAIFTMIAKDGAIAAGVHLPFPGLGHLKANGKGWTYLALPYAYELK